MGALFHVPETELLGGSHDAADGRRWWRNSGKLFNIVLNRRDSTASVYPDSHDLNLSNCLVRTRMPVEGPLQR